MSLFYPPSAKEGTGKSSVREDRYTAKFIEIIPSRRIVRSILFDSSDPAFTGEMIMEIGFDPIDRGTRVTFVFRNIPAGIWLEDNKAGTEMTLDKQAGYIKNFQDTFYQNGSCE